MCIGVFVSLCTAIIIRCIVHTIVQYSSKLNGALYLQRLLGLKMVPDLKSNRIYYPSLMILETLLVIFTTPENMTSTAIYLYLVYKYQIILKIKYC